MMKLIVLVCSLVVTLNIFAQLPPSSQAEANRQEAQAEEERIRAAVKKDLELSKRTPKSKLITSIKLPLNLKKRLKINDADKDLIKGNKKLKIVKLWNDECGNNRIIDLNNEKCFEQSEFSAGSHYSFYHRDYNQLFFGNIGYRNDDLLANSNPEWTQILVDLGDISIVKVEAKSIEVVNMKSFNFFDSEKEKVQKHLKTGVSYKNLNLLASSKLTLNHTYLLRSIFFDVVEGTHFNFDFIYAFRIVEQKDNVATIIWKEIQRKRRF